MVLLDVGRMEQSLHKEQHVRGLLLCLYCMRPPACLPSLTSEPGSTRVTCRRPDAHLGCLALSCTPGSECVDVRTGERQDLVELRLTYPRSSPWLQASPLTRLLHSGSVPHSASVTACPVHLLRAHLTQWAPAGRAARQHVTGSN
jgi:hypothetical protein